MSLLLSPFTGIDSKFSDIYNTITNDTNFIPATDITESNDSFLVSAELPGLDKKDIKIAIDDKVLTISGEKSYDESKTDHSIERSYGKFARSFNLPDSIIADKIKAKFKNGVIEVTIPKKEVSEPKKISISVD